MRGCTCEIAEKYFVGFLDFGFETGDHSKNHMSSPCAQGKDNGYVSPFIMLPLLQLQSVTQRCSQFIITLALEAAIRK